MELIIKPTPRCNFNCTFCSAKSLNIQHSERVSEKLKEVLYNLNPSTIIFTGGDPLMVSPSYYEEILSLGDWTLSFTTNLKDFYLNPTKWTPLFKNQRVGVITSFQYGDDRKWDKNTPYTEDVFTNVIEKFNQEVGYKPNFISIISEANEHKAIDHIYLAQRLGNKCRLNGQIPAGLSTQHYPRYKMMKIWLKIIELGLDEYELTCLERNKGKCNFNSSLRCDKEIRAYYFDNHGEAHSNYCEDLLSLGLENSSPEYNKYISNECVTCELCNLCNGCKVNKILSEQDATYCEQMVSLKEQIIKTGWKI